LSVTSSVLNAKDKADIDFAVKAGADYIALSFLRNAADIKEAKQFIGKSKIKIIAKIERPEALLNIEEIIDEADAVMVARGDLGIETPLWELPIRQKEIIESARKKFKPVIVATQMLDSMIRNAIPTRAEVSDVANAVFDSTDAVMLSGETAQGKHPIEAVDIMRKILEATDNSSNFLSENIDKINPPHSVLIAKSILNMATDPKIKLLIANAVDQTLPEAISHFRPKLPIIAITNNNTSAQIFALVWGVTPIVIKGKKPIDSAKDKLIKAGLIKKGDGIVYALDADTITTDII
jgi:pyruvate kinase